MVELLQRSGGETEDLYNRKFLGSPSEAEQGGTRAMRVMSQAREIGKQ